MGETRSRRRAGDSTLLVALWTRLRLPADRVSRVAVHGDRRRTLARHPHLARPTRLALPRLRAFHHQRLDRARASDIAASRLLDVAADECWLELSVGRRAAGDELFFFVILSEAKDLLLIALKADPSLRSG